MLGAESWCRGLEGSCAQAGAGVPSRRCQAAKARASALDMHGNQVACEQDRGVGQSAPGDRPGCGEVVWVSASAHLPLWVFCAWLVAEHARVALAARNGGVGC